MITVFVPLVMTILILIYPWLLLGRVTAILRVLEKRDDLLVSSWKIGDSRIYFYYWQDLVFELYLPSPSPVLLREGRVDVAGYGFKVIGGRAETLYKDLTELHVGVEDAVS
jgi:hypothetical protein